MEEEPMSSEHIGSTTFPVPLQGTSFVRILSQGGARIRSLAPGWYPRPPLGRKHKTSQSQK